MRINAYVVMVYFVLSLFVIAEALVHWIQLGRARLSQESAQWSGSVWADSAIGRDPEHTHS